MRARLPAWLIIAGAAVVLAVAGGAFWARENAVTDPKLETYALELIPPDSRVVFSGSEKCGASTIWDPIFRPEDDCYAVVWMPPGDAPATERLDETFARAEQLGWSIEASPEGPLLRREGYNVLARALRDDILQQCRTAPPEQQRCGDTVVVRAE